MLVWVTWEFDIGVGLEWNCLAWFASVDLKKTSDRIEFDSVSEALEEQHVPKCYSALLWNPYRNQHGCISGWKTFDIQRGVRRGDVISSLLFNAGLGRALRKWKRKTGRAWFFNSVGLKD